MPIALLWRQTVQLTLKVDNAGDGERAVYYQPEHLVYIPPGSHKKEKLDSFIMNILNL